MRVHMNAMRVERGSGRFQTQSRDARPPAGGDKEPVTAQLAAVVEHQNEVVTIASRGPGVHSEVELDAVAPQHVAERHAQRFGLACQHVRRTLDDRDMSAEAAHRLSHFGTDRPAAENQQALRNGLHARHIAAAPHALQFAQAGHGRHNRIGTGRDHNVACGVAHAADVDHAGPGEFAGAADQVDALTGEPGLLSGVRIVRDHHIPPGQRGRDVHLRGGCSVTRFVHGLAGTEQRL
jgi:hypothetical protein